MTRRKLPLHSFEEKKDEEAEDEENMQIGEVNSMEELLAALNRISRKVGQGGNRVAPLAGLPQGDRERPPRRCANCGVIHQGKCMQLAIPPKKKPCWECSKPGHVSWECPIKTAAQKGLKALEDVKAFNAAENSVGISKAMFSVEDDEGFKTAPRGPLQRTKPTPTNVAFGDILKHNACQSVAVKETSRVRNTRLRDLRQGAEVSDD